MSGPARHDFGRWAEKVVCDGAVSTTKVGVSEDALKRIVRRLATLSVAGKVDVCPQCNGKGEYRGVDASGNTDWVECRACDGWGVVFGDSP